MFLLLFFPIFSFDFFLRPIHACIDFIGSRIETFIKVRFSTISALNCFQLFVLEEEKKNCCYFTWNILRNFFKNRDNLGKNGMTVVAFFSKFLKIICLFIHIQPFLLCFSFLKVNVKKKSEIFLVHFCFISFFSIS